MIITKVERLSPTVLWIKYYHSATAKSPMVTHVVHHPDYYIDYNDLDADVIREHIAQGEVKKSYIMKEICIALQLIKEDFQNNILSYSQYDRLIKKVIEFANGLDINILKAI